MNESDHGPMPRHCTDDHCVTCSDEGIPMRVDDIDESLGTASCTDRDGERAEVMIALVPEIAVGDWLLVHAGTALARLGRDDGASR